MSKNPNSFPFFSPSPSPRHPVSSTSTSTLAPNPTRTSPSDPQRDGLTEIESLHPDDRKEFEKIKKHIPPELYGAMIMGFRVTRKKAEKQEEERRRRAADADKEKEKEDGEVREETQEGGKGKEKEAEGNEAIPASQTSPTTQTPNPSPPPAAKSPVVTPPVDVTQPPGLNTPLGNNQFSGPLEPPPSSLSAIPPPIAPFAPTPNPHSSSFPSNYINPLSPHSPTPQTVLLIKPQIVLLKKLIVVDPVSPFPLAPHVPEKSRRLPSRPSPGKDPPFPTVDFGLDLTNHSLPLPPPEPPPLVVHIFNSPLQIPLPFSPPLCSTTSLHQFYPSSTPPPILHQPKKIHVGAESMFRREGLSLMGG